VQKLDLITALIYENENLASGGITPQVITHQPGQGIKALPHIRGVAVKVKGVLSGQCKHGYGLSSVRRTSGCTLSEHFTWMPLGKRKCNWVVNSV